ncbi:Cholinesterase [Tolypocladium ophioglossoides CBS 100239]|uniref:Carboxylic ester hydrolase n=1 Tax=Tolypocladium ophioglossoides (strain CBS 100239) TaxID=1163406 RepID=A0A0L0NK89_TOLOC|nr:Cholinesterase [Tolypocladium ophioglossoides CBS 100239]
MAGDEVSVAVNGGTVMGRHQPASAAHPKALDVFYGMPYATVERFQPAVMVPPPRSGTLRAVEPGPSQPFPMAPHDTAESPLRLNIFRPCTCSSAPRPPSPGGGGGDGSGSGRKGRLLPVLVYIHGGGFNFGHPLERDLAALVAWAPVDVLVVSVGYRLGALGFLTEGGGERNLGLRDQRTALEWVREWVRGFGGDGGDVTLMGVSAGAHSIGHHILSPSPLPFRKSILESGSPTARSVLAAAHPRPTAQLASLNSHARGKPLASLPVDDLLDASLMVWADNMASVCWPFQPVVDGGPGGGGIIPDAPLKLWDDAARSGRMRDQAVITGFCSHEGTSFVPQRAATNAAFLSFFKTLIPSLAPADLAALERLYPDPVTHPSSPYANPPQSRSRYGAQFTRLHEAYAHYAYICPVLHTAHSLSCAGATVYLYEYAALAPPFFAASHGDQAAVVAHDMALLRGKPGLADVAGAMNARWTRFTASADGTLDEALWPRFVSPFDGRGQPNGRLLVFGDGNDEAAGGLGKGTPVKTRTLTEREMEQCRFWWDRMELSQGMGVRSSL